MLGRVFTSIMGLWLTASISGVALQACPTHGGVMMPGMDAGAHHHGGDCSGGAASLPASTDPQSQGHSNAGHDCHHGHQCTCPGTCCATGVVTLAASRLVAIPVVPVAVAAPAPVPVSDVRAVAAVDVVLPLPLGPPASQV